MCVCVCLCVCVCVCVCVCSSHGTKQWAYSSWKVVVPALLMPSQHSPAVVCPPMQQQKLFTSHPHQPTSTAAHTHLCEVFSEYLYKVRHGKVQNVVPPGQLQDDVGSQEVIAAVQTRGKAVRTTNLQEPCNEILRYLNIP